jgi:probable rRNA maturation factor
MRALVIHRRHPALQIQRPSLRRAIAVLDAQFRATPADLPTLSPAARRRARSKTSGSVVPDGELSLSFLTDAALAALHAQFLDDPTTTDVITFEGDPALEHAGDICLSVDTAAAYAARHGLDFNEELLRYVIHGWLHLAGYDDLVPTKKRRMRAAEARALRLLRAAELPTVFKLSAKN